MEDFRDRLKREVKKRYNTYTEFVKEVGIQLSYFSRILSGDRTPSFKFFNRLGQLGFDLDYLFKGDSQQQFVVKEKELEYLVDTKVDALKKMVSRIDTLFDELNKEGIDLNQPSVTVLTKHLEELINLLRELAYFVDETLLENQDLLQRLPKSEASGSGTNLEEIKNQSSLLIAALNEELKKHRLDAEDINPPN